MLATTSSPVNPTIVANTPASRQPDLATHHPQQAARLGNVAASPVGHDDPFFCAIRSRLMVRLTFHGYQLLTLYAQHRSRTLTVLTFSLPTKHGEQTAQVWTDSERGTGIRVRSHSQPNLWHEVTRQHCTCYQFAMRGHCYHQDSAVEARDVLAKYQYVQRRGPWGE